MENPNPYSVNPPAGDNDYGPPPVPPMPLQSLPTPPQSLPTPPTASPVSPQVFSEQPQMQQMPAYNSPYEYAAQEPEKKGVWKTNKLGMLALIFVMMGVVLTIIPIVSLLVGPVYLAALVLSIVALVNKAKPIWISITALVCSVAFSIVYVLLIAFAIQYMDALG